MNMVGTIKDVKMKEDQKMNAWFGKCSGIDKKSNAAHRSQTILHP